MWDLFDSDEPDSEEDGDEEDEDEVADEEDEVEDEEKDDPPPRVDLGNTGDTSSSDDINEEYLAAKKHA